MNQILVESFEGVNAGGFIGPLSISFSYAPFSDMTIQILTLNSEISLLGVYPNEIYFASGQLTSSFYIFNFYSSELNSGLIILTHSGNEQHIYQF